MTVLEIVNAKILNTSITEAMRNVAIGEVEQVIKNYCKIDVVPEELYFTWGNMAVDLALYTYQSNVTSGSTDDIDSSDISSIKIGDTQISLSGGGTSGARSKALSSHKPYLDGMVMNYREQLNQFRRMVW